MAAPAAAHKPSNNKIEQDKTKISLLIFALVVASVAAQTQTQTQAQDNINHDLESRSLASQGIVVPKRTALIVGLNQQFKLRATEKPAAGSSDASGLLSPASLHWPLSRLQPRRPLASQQSSTSGLGGQQQQGLYLDRHQQEILAANPNLLNPSSLPSALLTRSAADPPHQHQHQQHQQQQLQLQLQRASQQLNDSARQIAAAAAAADDQSSQQQQLYRGYSLIELDVKSEADRRFIQDLYGNLSAALDEQAQNPHALTVSPYVDVDFWSFRQALNDQIDIMVSPKSRSFILGQLNRAKIRHRIKIDDIQARLDQQLAGNQPASGLSQTDMKRGGSSNSVVDSLTGRAGNPTLLDVNAGKAAAFTSASPSSTAGGLNGRQSSSANSKPMNDSQFFENYQRLADISQWLESLVEKNRDIGQIKVIGRSSQGRYLRVLKLGYDQQDLEGSIGSMAMRHFAAPDAEPATRNQPALPVGGSNASFILESFFRKQATTKKLGSIWLDGGTHAREWISPSTVLYIAFRLSDNHNRCYHFFEGLKTAAQVHTSNAAAAAASTAAGAGAASSSYEHQQEAARQARRYSSSVDQSLVNGINEINTSLLGGKPLKQSRPRTEFEHTLELLAKSPQEVASEHGCDLEMDQLLRRYTFFVMPVLNPDGYEYSHTHNRLWRKTRSTSNHPIYRHFCLGADPNRNYDARHGATGSSTHPCSQTFAGSVPFTEPETRHHSNFVYANRLGMKMYISFHSYSQMILLPYSHSKQLAPDHKDLESVGLAAAKAIEQTHGTIYRVGPSASILYTASGTASDWAYEKAGIKYSYTMELRDTGTYGFLLPRQQIVPTGEETFNGLLAMINQMEKNDNLLTSKSTHNLFGSLSASASSDNSSSVSDSLNHVPDSDQFGASWKNRNSRPGAQLESVHEHANGQWSSHHHQSGVRDRKPATEQPPEAPQPNLSGAWSAGEMLGDEEIIDENRDEPDAGYAFEGEGELMEPTNSLHDHHSELSEMAAATGDNSIQVRANRRLLQTSESNRLAGRRLDHSRRIAQSAGLTPTGRNYINSPLVAQQPDGSRASSSSPIRRRESSEDLVGFGRATVARRL